MQSERYEFFESQRKNVYTFKSIGRKGLITKIVQFEQIGDTNFYNLAFGDLDSNTGMPNDLSKSNNGDREKVLSTISLIISDFIEFNPNAIVYAKGSAMSRTRLYQMGICKYITQISDKYVIFGVRNDEVLPFEKNINYDSFLVSLK